MIAERVVCGLCGKPDVADYDPSLLGDDHYCFGCQTIICDRHGDARFGMHEPQDHELSEDDPDASE